mmetsp:Transcript_28284/g.76634  ORF Transcript_28284/g.76634 Transcript_28284/m.76634 type:complete len:347 (+) Transcript_28284:226-1266(+)
MRLVVVLVKNLDFTRGSATKITDILVASIPKSVEDAGSIGTLVGVSSKEVTLRLDQVGRQAGTAVLVVVSEGGSGGRNGNSIGNSKGDNTTPGILAGVEFGSKTGVDHEVGKVLIASNGFSNSLEELGADDASTTPHACAQSQIDVPSVFVGGGLDRGQSLRVGRNLRAVKGGLKIFEDLVLIDRNLAGTGAFQDLRGGNTLVLAAGKVSSVQGGSNGGCCNGLFGGFLDGPATSSLHAGLVEDVVYDFAFLTLVVLLSEDNGSDFDQVRIQFGLVPFGEQFVHFLVVHPDNTLENIVTFANQLHITVFDSVVNHLDVVPGSNGSTVSGASFSVNLSGALREDGLD